MNAVLIAAAIFAFILIAVAKTIDDKKHAILKVFLICVVVISTIVVGKVAQENDNFCSMEVLNRTDIYIYGNNYSGKHWDLESEDYSTPPQADPPVNAFHVNKTFTYGYVCDATGNTSGLTLYRLILGFVIVFFLYVAYYLVYEVLTYAGKKYKER